MNPSSASAWSSPRAAANVRLPTLPVCGRVEELSTRSCGVVQLMDIIPDRQ
jgi:hypothetical protein